MRFIEGKLYTNEYSSKGNTYAEELEFNSEENTETDEIHESEGEGIENAKEEGQ